MHSSNPHINKLLYDLADIGIYTSMDDEWAKTDRLLDNIVFEKEGKQLKIYAPLFFREFGQSKYYKKNGDYKYVDLDDETYYEFQKIFILSYFK